MYRTTIDGNEQTDTFPYAVINTDTGQTVNRYTHRSVADAVTYSLNTGIAGPMDEIGEHTRAALGPFTN